MARGIYDLERKEPVYYEGDDALSGAEGGLPEVAWRVELMNSQACWYDLVMNPPAMSRGSQPFSDELRGLQAQVVERSANQPGQCLIGFWAARTKVRFCTSKPPRYALLGGELIFYVELGSQGVRKKMATTFVDVQTGRPVRPHVEVDERFITINLPDEEPETVSIYDFLRKCGLEVGISTDVYAVAATRTPLACWLNGVNRNLTEMLYRVSNDEHDFFFFCNLFKVTPVRLDSGTQEDVSREPVTWGMLSGGSIAGGAQASKYEVSTAERTHMIERALRTYFQTRTPVLIGSASEDEERFTGWAGAAKGQVFSVQVLIEQSNPHELYRFASQDVPAADKHMFTCRIEQENIEVDVLK